jgi:protein TonB
MSVEVTSKFSSRAIGNYAFGGSLILHAGFLLMLYTWQWEWKAPAKNPPVTVKVNFIAEPPPSKTSEQSASQKIAPYPPAHPQALHTSLMPALKARAPQSHVMAHPHMPIAVKMTPISKKTFKKRTAQRISFPKLPEPSGGIRPLKIAQKIPNSIEVGSRPSPVLNSVSVESIQPINPAKTGMPDLKTVLHRRPPVRQGNFPSSPGIVSKPAISIKTQESGPGSTTRRPISPQFLETIQASLTPQNKASLLSSPETTETKIAAFSRNFQHETNRINDANVADLEALRGLFAGKVRQRIIGARNYPKIARKRGQEGQPVIAFTLDREGRLIKADLKQSSGYHLLDQAALEAVRQGAPYPEIPPPLKMDTIQFKLPISFVLK